MTSIDERTVKMRFDNAQFKKGAAETQAALSKVDAAVANSGKGRGLLDMAGHMETVRVKASAMQVVVVTALANIVTKAVDAGLRLGKALTLDPITQGFAEYELKIKSIQTILANTKGETLATVTEYLAELNEYSDKTIYNFAQMTTAIGKMTTAGIQLDDATAVVKGFHNMVALAGGDATAAAQAMEQFVYGLQAGQIKALDWQSIATRGLGSQSLQKAFYETAKAAGTLQDMDVDTTFDSWMKAHGGFKGSLESGWLTSEVAVDALGIMTGDIKDMQTLLDMGFSEQAAKDMLDVADKAVDAATKVRTLTSFMGTLKEQIGSGWSQVLEIVFGDIDEATKLFTGMSDATGKVIAKIFGYLTKLAQGWEDFGGRTAFLETMKNLLAPIGAILGVIAKAWKRAFGDSEAGRGISTFMKAIQHLTRPLRILAQVISGQMTPLEAWHRLITVTKNALRNLADYMGGKLPNFEKLFGKVPGGDSVLSFIKDFAREVREAIEDVEKLVEGTGKIGDVFDGFKLPDFGGGGESNKILGFAGALKNGVTQLTDPNAAKKESQGGMFNPDSDISAGRVNDIPAGPDGTSTTSFPTSTTETAEKAVEDARTMGEVVLPMLKKFKDGFVEFFEGMNFDDLIAAFNIGVLATFMISMSNFFNTLTKSFEGFVGVGEGVNGILSGAGDALKSFQTAARAKMLIAIAIAIGILAVSLWLLSRIPEDKLLHALIALAGIAAILKVSMDSLADVLDKMDGKSVKMVALGIGLVLLAISVSILATAMKKLNDVDWASVLKAAIAIEVLKQAMKKLAEMDKDGLIKASIAMVIIAGALLLFTIAIKKFSGLDFKVFAEGLLYISVALYALTTIMDKFTSSIAGALALVVVVGAMWLLYDLIVKFSQMDFKTFAKGMALVAIALGLMVFVMQGFQSSLLGAAALYVVTYALEALFGLISKFADLDWGTFLKGLGMLALTLLVVGGALALISLVAGPIALLAGALALLAFGLAAMALALAVIFPLLAAGTGVFIAFATGAAVAFAVFMMTLAAQAPIIKDAFLKILQTIIDTIVEAVPMLMKGMQDLWDAFVAQVKDNGSGGGKVKGLMGDTGKSWIETLRDAILKKLPAMIDAGMRIAIEFVKGIGKRIKELAGEGATAVANFIDGIASKIDGIVSASVNLIVALAKGLGDNAPRLAKAGMKLIGDWLQGLADAIRSDAGEIGSGIMAVLDAMKDVGMDLVNGLLDGLQSMVGDAMGAIRDLASDMIQAAKDKFKVFSPSRVFRDIGKFLVQGLTNGVQQNAVNAINAVASMVGGQIAIANEYISGFIQKLDQQALAAGAKAAGLADAAEEASRSADRAARKAEKTKKNKQDDRKARKAQGEAERLSNRAETQAKRAERAAAKVEEAKAAQDRADEYEEADLLTKAQMRSEDAQMSMDQAKEHEFNAARNLAAAEALDKQAGAKGVTAKDAKAMRKEADRLRKQAETQAKKANQAIEAARGFATDALTLQTLAGDEASLSFQEQYDQEAADEAADEAFSKLTDAEKAVKRREEAAALQKKADQQLIDAKKLAYTDLEAANELAETAMANAAQARAYIDEAEDLEEKKAGGTGTSGASTGGRVVNTAITDAAGLAMQRANDRYSGASAAAAATPTVEFNQYNNSPESLNPSEVYRRTHNLLDTAGERLLIPAA